MTSLDEHAWELLLERISAQRCTPFLGAGFSAHPKGADIAHRWARRVPVSTALESPTGPPGPAEARLDPYVGPEPFRREDAWRFFGRREQAEELLSFVIASRTVLLYAQSGAGKTSLVNAGLLPLAEAEGFEILPPARVQGVLPEGMTLDALSNPYCFFTLLSWRGSGTGAAIDPHGMLSDALRARPRPEDRFGTAVPRLLVFDQFEELFTSYPEHWAQRRGLFEQVREALDDDPELRVLFVIREDHLADLWAMADLTPDGMRSRFRLSRLGPEEAVAAIEGPLERTDRSFAGGVVEELVKELLEVRVETRPGVTAEIVGEFVEPVQLQVVCSGLWKSLPEGATVITAEHARRFGNVTAALTEFYEGAVAETSAATGVKGHRVREWCSSTLITPAGTRAMVYRGVEETGGMPNLVVDALEDRHIVRAESRAGARWYELTHDRFIDPIQQSNARAEQLSRRKRVLWLGIVAGIGIAGPIVLAGPTIPWLPYSNVILAIAATGAIWATIGLALHNRRITVVAGLALLLAVTALPAVSFGVTPVVPDVVSLSRAAATARLRSHGFRVVEVPPLQSTVPVGTVLVTQPTAGSHNRRGTKVYILISRGTPRTALPTGTSLTVLPASGPVGTSVRVSGRGFRPHESIRLGLGVPTIFTGGGPAILSVGGSTFGTTVVGFALADIQADAAGAFSGATFAVPTFVRQSAPLLCRGHGAESIGPYGCLIPGDEVMLPLVSSRGGGSECRTPW